MGESWTICEVTSRVKNELRVRISTTVIHSEYSATQNISGTLLVVLAKTSFLTENLSCILLLTIKSTSIIIPVK